MVKPTSDWISITPNNDWEVLKREEFKDSSSQELEYLFSENEKSNKLPEFEKKLHREKSDETRKIRKEKLHINQWQWKEYKVSEVEVIINPELDIKEYVSWVPQGLIGKQLFSIRALKRLGLLKRLLANSWVVKKIMDAQVWINYKEKFQNFCEKYKKWLVPAYRDPKAEWWSHFFNDWIYFFLADWDYAYLNTNYMWYDCNNIWNKDWFFPVCLLEETTTT